MRATVLDVSNDQIYLQVGDQLRFKAHFATDNRKSTPHKADTVDFDFDRAVDPVVVIRSVVTPPHQYFQLG